MDVKDAVCVITGGAGGIGCGVRPPFAAAGAAAVVVVDRDPARRRAVRRRDRRGRRDRRRHRPAAVDGLVQRTLAREGRIDLFCSNAGILTGVGLEDPDDRLAARLRRQRHGPRVRRPRGAAGDARTRPWLPAQHRVGGRAADHPGDAPYTVTKHGAVGLAEWLAITYGSRGIGVSVLCPLGVATPMLMDPLAAGDSAPQRSPRPARSSPRTRWPTWYRRRWPRNGS